jgi:polynucleotide 5'-kinase involved in rRNA processing
MVKFLDGSLSRAVIDFDANREVTITKYLLNSKYLSVKLTDISIKIAFKFTPCARLLQFQSKGKKYSIEQLLTPAENNWLKSEIISFIDFETTARKWNNS